MTQWMIFGQGDGDNAFVGPFRSRERALAVKDQLNALLPDDDGYRFAVRHLDAPTEALKDMARFLDRDDEEDEES